MTTLVCEELRTTLEEEIRFTHFGRIHLAGLYPYLLKFGNPLGTFKVELLKAGNPIVSETFSSAEISATGYAHTFHPILPSNPVQIEPGLYTLKLSATGYAFNSSAYIAWIRQHENIQVPMEYIPGNDSKNPLTFRVKLYKQGIE